MKIAIQGHLNRGKEVIQLLESLGGKKRDDLNGRMFSQYYFINCYGDIDLNLKINLLNHKLYTLEEFEKEFPFKVGDTVITTCGRVGIISSFTPDNDKFPYCIVTERGLSFHPSSELKPYKEMDTRNITLTLEKAREWYKKGGELKEIALQAFTEKELNPLPRSWEEFVTNRTRSGYYISSDGKPLMCASSGKLSSPHVCPSKESAEAHLAMIQLEQLRDCWRQGWKPEYHTTSYAIKRGNDEIHVIQAYSVSAFLSFPTQKMAGDFLAYFRDLIEQAKDLI